MMRTIRLIGLVSLVLGAFGNFCAGDIVLLTSEQNGMYNVKVSMDTQSMEQGLVQVNDPQLRDNIGANSWHGKDNL